jgi:hypothetical protein
MLQELNYLSSNEPIPMTLERLLSHELVHAWQDTRGIDAGGKAKLQLREHNRIREDAPSGAGANSKRPRKQTASAVARPGAAVCRARPFPDALFSGSASLTRSGVGGFIASGSGSVHAAV